MPKRGVGIHLPVRLHEDAVDVVDVRMAWAMEPATACLRNRHRQPLVRLSRRILSAHQTLKVRPQPGRPLRLLQKTRRARTVFCLGLLSSKPRK